MRIIAARSEKEWSLESNGSGDSTASASKRRHRATIVAVEPRVEVRFLHLFVDVILRMNMISTFTPVISSH